MIHIHARTPDGVPSYEVEDFRAITEAILDAVDDVIINYSTGAIGVPIEKRIEYLRALKPDVAALNMGSMNYAKYSSGARTSSSRRCSRTRSTRSSSSSPRCASWASGRSTSASTRARGEPRPADRHGPARRAAADLVRDGRDGRHPPTPRNLAHMSEQIPGDPRAEQLGRDRISRDQCGSSRRRRRSAATCAWARGQLLSAERRDGAFERRPRRRGAADGRGRRPARRDGGGGPRAARHARAGWR